jgi:hypothetical protein
VAERATSENVASTGLAADDTAHVHGDSAIPLALDEVVQDAPEQHDAVNVHTTSCCHHDPGRRPIDAQRQRRIGW